jgi:ferredoxin
MSGNAELRLRVDWIRCDGFGLCGDLIPDVISLDDWRYPVLPDGPIDPSLRSDVQRAVDCCPERALFLESVPATSVEHAAATPGARRRPAGRSAGGSR